jgi:hypothetical protein
MKPRCAIFNIISLYYWDRGSVVRIRIVNSSYINVAYVVEPAEDSQPRLSTPWPVSLQIRRPGSNEQVGAVFCEPYRYRYCTVTAVRYCFTKVTISKFFMYPLQNFQIRYNYFQYIYFFFGKKCYKVPVPVLTGSVLIKVRHCLSGSTGTDIVLSNSIKFCICRLPEEDPQEVSRYIFFAFSFPFLVPVPVFLINCLVLKSAVCFEWYLHNE